jgi:amino acid adenylation domain-containing protein
MTLSAPSLSHLFRQAVARFPQRLAASEPGGGRMTYRELDQLSDRIRDRLIASGIGRGDRVGIHLPKSIDSLATVLGTLKAGAAYVPVDPQSPAGRAAFIFHDCAVKLVVVEQGAADAVHTETAALGVVPPFLRVAGTGRGDAIRTAVGSAPEAGGTETGPDEVAYVLYTSGSTGKPKGVTLTHRAAISFVDWCSEVFAPTEDDVFSSHAPFHFDLSILDLYVSLKHGARVVLIGEELGKEPLGLAAMIPAEEITIWYSTPSILSMLMQFGRLERHDLSKVRIVLFAGEVFPVPRLRALKQRLPHPRYYNLYGPTETNVCTYHEIPAVVPEDRTEPYPIGKVCSHLRARVVDLEDRTAPKGEEGELVIAGPGIMTGYWNLPERNAAAFLIDPDGTRWYHTGDVVVEEADGTYLFHGRRDRMVKRRGYRIELGEIEAALTLHPRIREVAVVALPDPASGVRITAFLSAADGQRPTLIELKRFAVEALPRYMAPDAYVWLDAIPRTSTDKTDYQTLKARA